MNKILTLTKYYLYSIKRNKGRIIDLFIWPVLELLVFGFMGLYLKTQTSENGTKIVAIILGSLIFWHFFARISGEIYQQLFDDVASKNLQNILITPIKTGQIILALVLAGLVKLLINITIVGLTAFLMYKFNFLKNNPFFIPMILILMIWGVSVGIFIASLLFVFGNKALAFSWVITGLVQPFSCVFYSREVLPNLINSISYLVPSSYIFEIYRKNISGLNIYWSDLFMPFLLSIIYLLLAIFLFFGFIKLARKKGLLMKL